MELNNTHLVAHPVGSSASLAHPSPNLRTIFTFLKDIAAQKCQNIHQIAYKSEMQEDSLLLTQSTKGQGRQVYIDE